MNMNTTARTSERLTASSPQAVSRPQSRNVIAFISVSAGDCGAGSRHRPSHGRSATLIHVETDGYGEVNALRWYVLWRGREWSGTSQQVHGLFVENGRAGAVDNSGGEHLTSPVEHELDGNCTRHLMGLRLGRITSVPVDVRKERFLPGSLRFGRQPGCRCDCGIGGLGLRGRRRGRHWRCRGLLGFLLRGSLIVNFSLLLRLRIRYLQGGLRSQWRWRNT